jgi:hypothetical protein
LLEQANLLVSISARYPILVLLRKTLRASMRRRVKARFSSELHDFEQCKAVFLKGALHFDRNEERTRIDRAAVLENDYMLYVEDPSEAWRAAIPTGSRP